MKNVILLFLIGLFSINIGFSQGMPTPIGNSGPGGGGGEGFCPCCEEDFIDPATGAPYPDDAVAYDECVAACSAGNNPCAVPIDTSLILLLIAGVSLGIYFISRNNKITQLEI